MVQQPSALGSVISHLGVAKRRYAMVGNENETAIVSLQYNLHNGFGLVNWAIK